MATRAVLRLRMSRPRWPIVPCASVVRMSSSALMDCVSIATICATTTMIVEMAVMSRIIVHSAPVEATSSSVIISGVFQSRVNVMDAMTALIIATRSRRFAKSLMHVRPASSDAITTSALHLIWSVIINEVKIDYVKEIAKLRPHLKIKKFIQCIIL